MANIVYIGTSLDGYIADAKGGVEWMECIEIPEGDDMGFSDFMARIDAVVMGRVTFETLIGFGVGWHYGKPGIILSSTMTEAPPEFAEHVTFASGTRDAGRDRRAG